MCNNAELPFLIWEFHNLIIIIHLAQEAVEEKTWNTLLRTDLHVLMLTAVLANGIFVSSVLNSDERKTAR